MSFEYYRALGISKDASDEEIKQAYKQMALMYNPKRHARRPKTPDDPLMSRQEKANKQRGEEAHRAKMYLAISEAYEVLSDPLKKAVYDKFGETGLKQGVSGSEEPIPPFVYHGDPDKTFREFFNTDNPFVELIKAACGPSDDFSPGGSRNDSQGFRPKNQSTVKDLPITLEDAYKGAIRKVIVPKKFLCGDGATVETRDHVLTIKIPRGADEGMEFVFPNEGDESPNAVPSDIVFRITVQPHPVFKREGNNLVMMNEMNLSDALGGAIIPVNTLDGRSFRVCNVHLVQPGYEKVIMGEGMPILGEPDRKGDLIIRFKVDYPNRLDQSQREKLRAALGGGAACR